MDTTQQIATASDVRGTRSLLRRETLLVVAAVLIVGLALGLRLYGLAWDEGSSFTPHPDERAILMKVGELSPPAPGELGILFDAEKSPWNPRWFAYGSLPLYALKGVELVYEAATGDQIHDLRLAGRLISALADVGTVIMVLLLGVRLYGRRVGLLASGLVALTVLHIQLSHFYAVDTLLALFVIVATFFMYRVAREGRTRDSLLAGVFIGLGLATKASLAPLLLAYAMAHLLYLYWPASAPDATPSAFKERLLSVIKRLVAGGVAAGVVFFITQPYAFLDWSRFYADFTEQSEMVRRIRDYPYTRQYIDTTPYLYQLRQLATWGTGWPLGIVAWAGLLFVAMRGMRPNLGIMYLALGWGVPMALLLLSGDVRVVVLASAIAFLALVATLPFRSEESRMDVLLLAWVVPYFLIIGAFQVKFLRYLVPITPFLVLFGSRMLFALWERASELRPVVKPWLVAGLVLLIGSTAFYALSYMSVYSTSHTAVRASEWINQNVPGASVILKEHWEEGLPNLHRYRLRELPMYERDSLIKFSNIAKELAEADYLVFFSNRLYGTLPRLPDRYPISREYYRLLFNGHLGYRLVHFEESYPNLFGLSFVDDTFGRPDVPEPASLRAYEPSRLTLGLGFADESFTVYDHPKVLVFRNEKGYDAASIERLIQVAASESRAATDAARPETDDLQYSPEDAAAQRRGGTWSEIVDRTSWTNRLPVLAWLIVVEGLALLALPASMLIFRPLPDRGYLFSKVLGILAVSVPVWLLASLGWLAFSRGSIMLAATLLALVSAAAIAMRGREMTVFVRERWRILAIGEIIFMVAFFAFVLLRMANPDLWHPFRGGEKPMDMAYLNAVLQSSYMPPYDPWFGGGYLNYYYWGQFMVATLIKATGIDPAVAVNLAVPLMFALTVGGAFALVYSLAEGTRRRIGSVEGNSGHGRAFSWSPVWAGVGGAAFVAVLGNLDGAVQLGQGIWRALFRHMPFGQFDFWRSSRMMAPDPPGFEITEFPYFTFLFADLHAHLIVIPITLLVLGLALALVLGATARRGPQVRRRDEDSPWNAIEIARLAVLGVAVGALRAINTWDFPTYLAVAIAAIVLAAYFRHGGLSFSVLLESALKAVFVFLVGYLVFLPFHLNYETFFNTLEATTNQTVLWQFLAISGLFVFVLGSFFINEVRDWLSLAWRAMSTRIFGSNPEALPQNIAPEGGALAISQGGGLRIGRLVAMLAGALVLGYSVSVLVVGPVGSTIPFLVLMLVLVGVVSLRWLTEWQPDAPHLTFMAVMVGLSLVLAIGLDVVRVEGDIDRMNSVFKVYLQVWVMLGLASAYALWRLAHGRLVPLWKLAAGKKLWLAALVLLIASAAVYPIMGTHDRLRDRFDTDLPLTLNGMAYMEGTVYHDREGDIELAPDLEGIRWLQDNVRGSPVVLEGHTPTYRWGGRISKYTGLPSVIGWQWHQEQQRWNARGQIAHRIYQVRRMYETTDADEALSLMREHGVEYVYVGQLERLYYPGDGIGKFERSMNDALDKVYENGEVAIYRVRDTVASTTGR